MKKIITLIICFGFVFTSFGQPTLPATKTVDASDTYFGVTYKDPYRWLESIDKPEVVTWFKQQADYTNSVLSKLKGRDELIAEWKQLDKLQPPRIGSITHENGRIFYRKTMPGENVGKLYFRQGLNGKETLLFDPKSYIKGKTLSIDAAVPSYDGEKIAIGYSEQGAEVSTIKVMNVDSGKFLTDSIYPSAGVMNWTFDNKGFFYMWIKSADNKDPGSRLNPKTKLHIVGSATSNDADFFSNGSYPELNNSLRNGGQLLRCQAFGLFQMPTLNHPMLEMFEVQLRVVGRIPEQVIPVPSLHPAFLHIPTLQREQAG